MKTLLPLFIFTLMLIVALGAIRVIYGSSLLLDIFMFACIVLEIFFIVSLLKRKVKKRAA